MQTQGDYVTAAEFSRALGYAQNYTYGLLVSGRVPARKLNGQWLIATEEIEKRRTTRRVRKGAGNAGK